MKQQNLRLQQCNNHVDTYVKNRRWSDNYMPIVKQLIGGHLLEVSGEYMDTKRCADLVVLKFKYQTVAVRLRRWEYQIYAREFTIRRQSLAGGETEHSKIRKGFGDVFFYGFAHDESRMVPVWHLIDLDVFRETESAIRGMMKDNYDGTGFIAYQYRQFPDNLIIAKSAR